MISTSLHNSKTWLKHHPNPHYRRLFFVLKKLRSVELRTPQFYNQLCGLLLKSINVCISELMRLLVYTPSFRGRLSKGGKHLFLYGGMPYVSGPLNIHMGQDCRLSGQTTFSGRPSSHKPCLMIGNNVGIGWQTTIAVGNEVIIEDNVRIAGRSFLFGYSGHPIDAIARAKGNPDLDSQVGQIHLKRDVWLGSNVTVAAGVTIGQGTVVATGSVVTKSLPDFVLAAGNPARVIRSIADQQSSTS